MVYRELVEAINVSVAGDEKYFEEPGWEYQWTLVVRVPESETKHCQTRAVWEKLSQVVLIHLALFQAQQFTMFRLSNI